ncbi:MAG: response regulator [bacterium]|nr:response regulator [bacterium]
MDKKRILVVEDEPDYMMALTIRLSVAGYEVIQATDGLQGYALAKRERPDLILLDIMLPKMDGFKVCRLLKFDSNYSSIPILMLTARGMEEDLNLGSEVGADGYLTKLIDPKTLIENIETLLHR